MNSLRKVTSSSNLLSLTKTVASTLTHDRQTPSSFTMPGNQLPFKAPSQQLPHHDFSTTSICSIREPKAREKYYTNVLGDPFSESEKV